MDFQLAFLGDFCPSCHYARQRHLVERALSAVRDRIGSQAIALVNLECRVTPTPVWETTAVELEMLDALSSLRPAVVNVANNHFFDHGTQPCAAVRDRLAALGIPMVGLQGSGSEGYEVVELSGRRLGIVSRVARGTNPASWGDGDWRMSPLDHDEVVATVGRLRPEVDFLVVSLHWGAEYYGIPSPWQKRLASRLADAGADVLWGHHAHRLQESGWYGKTLVLYNLGNFLFGSEGDDRWPRESRHSRIVRCRFPERGAESWEVSLEHDGALRISDEARDVPASRSRGVSAGDYVRWSLNRCYRELGLYAWRYLRRRLRRAADRPAPLPARSAATSSPQPLGRTLLNRLHRCVDLRYDE